LNVLETSLPGVLILEPIAFEDQRGFFIETYNRGRFRELGIEDEFVQDNHSHSCSGVLRGLHFQEPNPQGKLVRCTLGSVFDVAVDIRRGSPTFGQWTGTELSEKNMRLFWVPPGFAHGFCVTSDAADLVYKCTALYDRQYDRGVAWNDPDLGIPWPIENPLLSEKDRLAPRLADVPFLPIYHAT
jgi:dTDP-4-dehydrorhamnose 3,5-epimerase